MQALIFETDDSVSATLGPLLVSAGVQDLRITRAPAAVTALMARTVNVAFLDARAPDDGAVLAARALLSSSPNVRLVVLGAGASRAAIFTLSQVGARAYLEAPFSEGDVLDCLRVTKPRADDLTGVVRGLVGEMTLKDAQQSVRATMLRQALEASRGSRRSAARLLGVTRPAVQRMLRELSWESEAPSSERRR